MSESCEKFRGSPFIPVASSSRSSRSSTFADFSMAKASASITDNFAEAVVVTILE